MPKVSTFDVEAALDRINEYRKVLDKARPDVDARDQAQENMRSRPQFEPGKQEAIVGRCAWALAACEHELKSLNEALEVDLRHLIDWGIGPLAKIKRGLTKEWIDEAKAFLQSAEAEIKACAGGAGDAWANARWIVKNCQVTADSLRQRVRREGDIKTRIPTGRKQPEYYLPDVERAFPGKAIALVKKYLAQK